MEEYGKSYDEKINNMVPKTGCDLEKLKQIANGAENLHFALNNQLYNLQNFFKPEIKRPSTCGFCHTYTNNDTFIFVEKNGMVFIARTDDSKLESTSESTLENKLESTLENKLESTLENKLESTSENKYKTESIHDDSCISFGRCKCTDYKCNHELTAYTSIVNNIIQLNIQYFGQKEFNVKYVQKFSIGKEHVCFIDVENRLYGFGSNKYGQLSSVEKNIPKSKFLGHQAENVACGDYHTIITNDSQVYVTGRNNKGQLGTGNYENVENFKKIAKGTSYIYIYASYNMTGVVSEYGILFVCGENKYGQLCFDQTINPTINILTPTFENVKSVSFGMENISIISKDFKLYVGGNLNGEIHFNPVKILDYATSVAIGNNFKYAIGYDKKTFDNSYDKICKELIAEDFIKYFTKKYIKNKQINISQKELSLLFVKFKVHFTNFAYLFANMIINSNIISYPYLKFTIEQNELEKRFNSLKTYEPLVEEKYYNLEINTDEKLIPWTYQGQKLILFSTENDKYINDLADYFTEKPRLEYLETYITTQMNHWKDFNLLTQLFLSTVINYGEISTLTLRKNLFEEFNQELHQKFVPEMKITVAYSIYKIMEAESILDINSGFSSRLIAAIAHGKLNKNVTYMGFNSIKNLNTSFNEIVNTFGNGDKHTYTIVHDSFINSKIPHKYTFDFVFFSPPLYNYSMSNISFIKKFMIPDLKKAWKLLQIDGILALNFMEPIYYFDDNDLHFITFVEPIILYILGYLKNSKYVGVLPVYYECDEQEEICDMLQFRPIWFIQKTANRSSNFNLAKNILRKNYYGLI